MMQVNAIQYTSPSEMRAAYAERWSRLRGKSKPAIILDLAEPLPKPLWRTEELTFAAHVDDWKTHVSEAGNPTVRFIKRRAKELGATYAEIIGTRHNRQIVAIRHQIVWEARQAFPHISTSHLGRMFNRDHATIFHTLRKMEAERAAE